MLTAASGGGWAWRFTAMASPCEILFDTEDAALARTLGERGEAEARRIERKFSRYRTDSVTHRINTAEGRELIVDEETARLIDFGAQLHTLSEGRFDLSSGVLRQVWHFDGGTRWPEPSAVAALMSRVGWQRVHWQAPRLRMPPGMALDFGGIGKEYAVDRVVQQLAEAAPELPVLVNFGGDLACHRPRRDGSPWRVGILESDTQIKLGRGAVATSGDAYRYLVHQGRRYGHLLDARTGYPVAEAPRAVTVAAATCSQAGALASLALLFGAEAEAFLATQGADYHVRR